MMSQTSRMKLNIAYSLKVRNPAEPPSVCRGFDKAPDRGELRIRAMFVTFSLVPVNPAGELKGGCGERILALSSGGCSQIQTLFVQPPADLDLDGDLQTLGE